MLPIVIDINRYLNAFSELQAQDRDQDTHFHYFSDSYANHRGVTQVISGGNFAQNRKKSQCFLILLIVINLDRCLNTINGLQSQHKDHDKPFQSFSDSYTNHRGSHRVVSGGKIVKNHNCKDISILCFRESSQIKTRTKSNIRLTIKKNRGKYSHGQILHFSCMMFTNNTNVSSYKQN